MQEQTTVKKKVVRCGKVLKRMLDKANIANEVEIREYPNKVPFILVFVPTTTPDKDSSIAGFYTQCYCDETSSIRKTTRMFFNRILEGNKKFQENNYCDF